MGNNEVSVQQLLAKIGQLAIQVDIAENVIASLNEEIAELKKQIEDSKEKPKK